MAKKLLRIIIALTTISVVVKAKVKQDMKINRLNKETNLNFKNLDRYLKKHIDN